jgi:uncharacterized protein (PEP-CTERM system associated)
MRHLAPQADTRQRGRVSTAVCGLVSCLLCASAYAEQGGAWQFTPRFSAEETYTDNVRQTQHDRSGDFITTLTPGLSVRGKTARLKTNIDYNWEQQLYFDQTEFNRDSHQLQADIASTLVKNWLYFDTNSRMSQQAGDIRRFVSVNSRGRNSGLTDVTSIDLAPRIEHNFGSIGDMRLGYTHQIVDRANASNTGNGSQNVRSTVGEGSSVEDGYNLSLKSGAITGRMPVGFTAESRDVDFETGRQRKFRNAATNLSYLLTRQFTLKGTGGYEANSYNSSQGRSNGAYWSAGGVWTPSPRTSLEFDWGERYFGNTVDVIARHRQRRWNFMFSYGTKVTTANQFERGLILVPLLDANGDPVFDPNTSDQILVPVDSPNATDDVFLETRLSGSLSYALHRGSLSLRYFESRRESQTSSTNNGNNNRIRGASLNLSHIIRPRLHTDFAIMWRNNKGLSNQDKEGNYYSFYPSVSYDLSRRATARLQYELTINNGASGFGILGGTSSPNFYENAISVTLAFHL